LSSHSTILLIVLAFIAGALLSAAVLTHQVQSVVAAPDSPTETFTCTPSQIAVFTNRIHMRCTTTTADGIYYFAVSTADPAAASRFLSIFTTAKVSSKNVYMYYTTSDTTGTAWGCLASNCRRITGAEVAP
jgi:zona occludens toxin (predicted ATPase)